MEGCWSLKPAARGQYPLAAPSYAHVAPSATNGEQGNWTENRCSTHLVRSIRVKDCGSRYPSEGCSGRSTRPTLTNIADLKAISSALNRVKWVQVLRPQPIGVLSERLCAGLQSHARGVRLARTPPCPGSRRDLLNRETVAELKTRVQILLGTPSRRSSTGESHRLLSDCVGVRVVPSRPIW